MTDEPAANPNDPSAVHHPETETPAVAPDEAVVSTPIEPETHEPAPEHHEPVLHMVADATVMEAPLPSAEAPAHEVNSDAAPVEESPADETEAKPKKARKPRKPKTAAAPEPDATGATEASPAAAASPGEAAPESNKKWYVVKVQSGREDTIKAAIERKVKIEGLEEFFGQIAIPVEELIQKKSVRVTDKKTGEKVTQEKKVIKLQKKYAGYIFAEVEFNDRILYLFRETSGVGDFVGASLKRDPTPMTDIEVRQMLTGVVEGKIGQPGLKKVKLDYEKGDKVKIRDGAFANMEGIVKSIKEPKDAGETPKVTVEVTIWGKPVEVDLDYWHVDRA